MEIREHTHKTKRFHENNMIELIVRYTGDLQSLAQKIGFEATELLGGYAVITIEQEKTQALLQTKEIIWTEVPARVYTEVANGRRASGVLAVQTENPGLTGQGVYVAIIDSGIDVTHPDFRNADGTTRIKALWDQTATMPDVGSKQPVPPTGYRQGVLYTEEMINAVLLDRPDEEGRGLIQGLDPGGHGTHVAGIAAGNGRASGGRYRGVAYESSFLVVKLGGTQTDPFPQTTNLMTAVDFCVKYAAERGVPLAVNLSFGNQEGAHDGAGLLETYLDTAALYGRTMICIGTGNDGASGIHSGGVLTAGETREERLLVATGERRLRLGIWLSALDEIEITLESPNGRLQSLQTDIVGTGVAVKGYPAAGGKVYSFGTTVAEVFYGQATPYRQLCQVEIVLGVTEGAEIMAGNWSMRLKARSVLDGAYDIWLSAGTINQTTGFLTPTPERTLTIPSTAARPIAVAAYDARTDSTAAFSGRGYPRGKGNIKPDLGAPGVDIVSCAPGGGYTTKSGTSMATPFVTGAAALLLQWGAVLGNDPYLYGERLKAALLYGAEPLSRSFSNPNREIGYGRLNLQKTMQYLTKNKK